MNKNKFDGMGNIYVQFRPTYPKDFIDYLYSDIEITRKSISLKKLFYKYSKNGILTMPNFTRCYVGKV